MVVWYVCVWLDITFATQRLGSRTVVLQSSGYIAQHAQHTLLFQSCHLSDAVRGHHHNPREAGCGVLFNLLCVVAMGLAVSSTEVYRIGERINYVVWQFGVFYIFLSLSSYLITVCNHKYFIKFFLTDTYQTDISMLSLTGQYIQLKLLIQVCHKVQY